MSGTFPPPGSAASASAVSTAIEIAIRLGAIGILIAGCFLIIAPFGSIVVWALIIAIATEGPFEKLCRRVGGRRNLVAALSVGVTLLLLLVPAVLLSATLVSGAEDLAKKLASGTLRVPHPAQEVAGWPLVGERLYALWKLAAENLTSALKQVAPQLKPVAHWLLGAAASTGVGVLQLVGSLLIAGVMLARSPGRRAAIERFAIRLAGQARGIEMADLAHATVQSVVQGIVGVALIQAFLAGAAFFIADIPAAGLWALLVLVAAVVQLPVILVMLPTIAIAFSSLGTVEAGLFTAWCIAIGLLDNVLKPLLFARGVRAPMLVIFIGALGGMLWLGIIGLFLGAVLLVLGHELFLAWLRSPPSASLAGGSTPTE
jgi:predicted PurR-regulated permease PerM